MGVVTLARIWDAYEASSRRRDFLRAMLALEVMLWADLTDDGVDASNHALEMRRLARAAEREAERTYRILGVWNARFKPQPSPVGL